VEKRKQAVNVMGDVFAIGQDLVEPFDGSRFVLDVCVGRVDREGGLSSSDAVRASFVAVMQVDTQDFGKAMANLSADRRHGWMKGGEG
jgi:hypothetical protein